MTTEPKWRRWLDAPIDLSILEPAPAPKRRNPIRLSSTPASPNRVGGRVQRGRGGAWKAAAVGAAVIVGGLLAFAGGGHKGSTTGSTAGTYAIVTTSPAPISPLPATTSAAPAFCAPGNSGATTVTNGPGNHTSAIGAISGYEHGFFVERDAHLALDFTDRGPGLPAESQLAQAITTIPAGTPWCVGITGLGGQLYQTAVHFQAAGQAATYWLLNITVTTAADGTYSITKIEDQAR